MRLNHIILISFSLFLASCFTEDNRGYPKTVWFSSEGGTQVLKGNDSFGVIDIAEGTEEYPSTNINDTIMVDHAWLSVKYKRGSHNLIITARPSDSDKKRSLRIYGYFTHEYAVIDVKQEGKK